MTTVQFDRATHTYSFAGRCLPSVTTLIKGAGLMPDYAFADTTMGELVHAMTEAYDLGVEFAWDDWPTEAYGYLNAWQDFRRAEHFVPTHIELRVHHVHGFAGTLDRLGWWRGSPPSGDDADPVLLDIKTGDPDRWHGVQLAGYALAAERMGLCARTITRLGVYLGGDGGYRLRIYSDARDFDAFNATVQRFRADETLNNWRAA